MPISVPSRLIHGAIALYHFVGVMLLYKGWPFVGKGNLAQQSIYGRSFVPEEGSKDFTCFGLNSQIIVGVLYAKVAFYGDSNLAATLCLPRSLIVVLHAAAVLLGRMSSGFLVVVLGEAATLACVYASLPAPSRVAILQVPPSPGRLFATPKRKTAAKSHQS